MHKRREPRAADDGQRARGGSGRRGPTIGSPRSLTIVAGAERCFQSHPHSTLSFQIRCLVHIRPTHQDGFELAAIQLVDARLPLERRQIIHGALPRRGRGRRVAGRRGGGRARVAPGLADEVAAGAGARGCGSEARLIEKAAPGAQQWFQCDTRPRGLVQTRLRGGRRRAGNPPAGPVAAELVGTSAPLRG